MASFNELIIRMQPYPQELKRLCTIDSNFERALKNTHPEKFVSLGAVIVSYPPNSLDQVIGFLVYDYTTEPGVFKKDFIVNVENRGREFRIYTRYRGVKKSRIIRDISHFYQEYPTYEVNSHHPSFEEIPDELKPRALQAVALANRLRLLGVRREISKEEYAWFDAELRKIGL
jgi:hypothetical protein